MKANVQLINDSWGSYWSQVELDFWFIICIDIQLDIQLDIKLDIQLDIQLYIQSEIQLDIQLDGGILNWTSWYQYRTRWIYNGVTAN